MLALLMAHRADGTTLPDPDFFDGLRKQSSNESPQQNEQKQNQKKSESTQKEEQAQAAEVGQMQQAEESQKENAKPSGENKAAQQEPPAEKTKQASGEKEGQQKGGGELVVVGKGGSPTGEESKSKGKFIVKGQAGENPDNKGGGGHVDHSGEGWQVVELGDFKKEGKESNRVYKLPAKTGKKEQIEVPEGYDESTSIAKHQEKVKEELSEKHEQQAIEQTARTGQGGAEHGKSIPQGL